MLSESDSHIYEFDEFCLDAGERVLLRDGREIPIQSKSLETLLVLIQNNGRVVSRDILMDIVWRDTFVNENNLSQHIRALRKVLGDGENGRAFIDTVPRRGYRFKANALNRREKMAEAGIEPARPNNAGRVPSEISDGRWLTSNRFAFFSILLTAILLIAAGFYWSRPRAGTQGNKNVSGREVASRFERSRTTKLADAEAAAISPDGKLVVYSQLTNGKRSLWIMQLVTGRAVQIAPSADREYHLLQFSPDSQFVFFSAPTVKAHIYDLYRLSVLGGTAMKIVGAIGGMFSISPREARIAYVRGDRGANTCSLLITDLDGRNETILGRGSDPHCYGRIAWSTDEESIIVNAGMSDSGDAAHEILEISVRNGTSRKVTTGKWVSVRDIAVLPAGDGILISGRRETWGDFNRIWHLSRKTGEIHPVSTDAVNYNSLSVSSDGRMIVARKTTLSSHLSVASATGAAGSERRVTSAFGSLVWLPDNRFVYSTVQDKSLWMISEDGGEQTQLDNDLNIQIAASADGQHLVSIKITDGKYHVWRMNRDGTGQMQLTNGDGEQRPVISPDNLWVYYNSVGGGERTIWKVPFDGGGALKVVDGAAATPSVSPDGTMLAYFAGPNDDVVIQNLETGQIVTLFKLSASLGADKICWSPGSDSIYYASETGARVGNVWQQPLAGGEPQKITDFTSDRIFDFQLSPDGSRIALTRGNWFNEVVLLSLPE